VNQYQSRISNFLQAIMDLISFEIDPEILIDSMVKAFRHPRDWGYAISEEISCINQMLIWVIAVEYLWGISEWTVQCYESEYVRRNRQKIEACEENARIILEYNRGT
jgi:hypothetical protein